MSNLKLPGYWGKLLSLIVVCSLLLSLPLFGPAVSEVEAGFAVGKIAYIQSEADEITLWDDLEELKSEGKIPGYDIYMHSYQMRHFWKNLYQYSIVFLEEDSILLKGPQGSFRRSWVGESFAAHKDELEEWIQSGGCLFVECQNKVSGKGNLTWDWLPAALQVTSREIRQGSNNLVVTPADPGIFSTPNKVDVTKATQDHGCFVNYANYTPVVKDDKVTSEEIILLYRTYGNGKVVLSHLEYPNVEPDDVKYVENLVRLCGVVTVCPVKLAPESQKGPLCTTFTVSTQGFDPQTMKPGEWTVTGVCDKVDGPEQKGNEWCIKVKCREAGSCEITFTYTINSCGNVCTARATITCEKVCPVTLKAEPPQGQPGDVLTVSTKGFDSGNMTPVGNATDNYTAAWTICGQLVKPPYQKGNEWCVDLHSNSEIKCNVTFSYILKCCGSKCTTPPATVEWKICECTVKLVPSYQKGPVCTTFTVCTKGFDSGNMTPVGNATDNYTAAWGINCDQGVADHLVKPPYQKGNEWCIDLHSDIEIKCEITFSYTLKGKKQCTAKAVVEWFVPVQLEKVPQVRWAGEKIVLEQRFGTEHAGKFVQFMLEGESPGVLESIDGLSTGSMVATLVAADGIARAILTSEKPGECDVSVALYGGPLPSGEPIDQHGFVVFFLKLESVSLGFVDGKRGGHDTGRWAPENPWDSASDLITRELNVSQDALLRMRVKGWFMGDNLSTRPEATLDCDGDGVADVTLPKGRWVLPDDWPKLAGADWKDRRPRWDVMDRPDDNITAPNELGPYDGDVNVPGGKAKKPVIGPFSSLDDYSGNPVVPADPKVPGGNRTTVVPNAKLDWWDCPMPAAKVIFKIKDGPGYFKEIDKGEIYYRLVEPPCCKDKKEVEYTNPFYAVEIPASDLIPPVVSNGGYSWDSWGKSGAAKGPYDFWTNLEPVTQGGDLEVYSDNHGEAMVYMNGDWNLNLTGWQSWAPRDVIAQSKVTAIVDYPYLRKHQPVASPLVTAKWTWGKEVKLHVQQMMQADPSKGPDPMRKLVMVYLCDRDGRAIVGEKVEWTVDGPAGMIESLLPNTNGVITTPHKRSATSYSRQPTPEEAAKYKKVFGEDCHHGIVGAVIFDSLRTIVDLHMAFYEVEGVLVRSRNLNFAVLDTDAPSEDLYQGYNLVTYKGPTLAVAEAVVTMPSGALVSIWHFDNESKEWEVYLPGAPPYASDLKRMVYLEPYAIVVNKDFTWVY